MMQGCLHMKVSTLRRLAYASMIIDHAAVVLIYPMYLAACMVGHIDMMGDLRPQKAIDLSMLYNIGRCIGRIAFPSFACMLVGGFLRSRDLKRYHLRLLFLAVTSEIPFDLALTGRIVYLRLQNVGFTLLVGLLMLTLLDKFSFYSNGRIILRRAVTIIASAMVLTIFCDGGFGGILMIAVIYLFRKGTRYWWFGIISSVGLLFLQSGAGWGGLWSIWLDIPFLFFINLRYSEGGRVRRRYYLIYPIHFLLLFVLKQQFVHLPI